MEYSKAEEVMEVLDDLLVDYRSDLKTVGIEVVFRDSVIMNKDKEVWARVHKVSNLYRFLIKKDFILEVYKNVWEGLSAEGRRALIAHELKHIKVDYDSKGERILNLIPHDFEEFEEIIQKYGFWKSDLKRLKEVVEGKNQLGGFTKKHVWDFGRKKGVDDK